MKFTLGLITLGSLLGLASASHTITFNSNCASSIMQLPGIGNYGTGTYTFDGDVNGGIASGGSSCDENGVPCTAVEFTLNDGYSTGDITLISPHVYSAEASFEFSNGQGATCASADCGTDNAFYSSTDYSAQRYDSDADAGITITVSPQRVACSSVGELAAATGEALGEVERAAQLPVLPPPTPQFTC